MSSPPSQFSYSLKNLLISIDAICDWWYWSHPVPNPPLNWQYPVVVFPSPVCMFLLARTSFTPASSQCKCCPSPARVSLLYTCVDGPFCCVLIQKNTISYHRKLSVSFHPLSGVVLLGYGIYLTHFAASCQMVCFSVLVGLLVLFVMESPLHPHSYVSPLKCMARVSSCLLWWIHFVYS